MAIAYLDGGRITGLSTDAKPDRDTSDITIELNIEYYATTT